MRILFLNHNVARKGGTFFRAYHLARYLVRAGHSVTLLTISADRMFRSARELSEGVEIVHTPDWLWGVGRTGWDPFDAMSRIVYLSGRRWDIIHAWDCRLVVILPALYARRCSRSSGGKLIIDWCDWWGRGGTMSERPRGVVTTVSRPVETFFEEAFRTRADGTTVASRALRDRVIGLGVSGDSVMMLPGGSDTETVRPHPMSEARTLLGITRDDWVVGYLGVLPAKEVGFLTSALVMARRSIPNLRFMAIGVSIAGSSASFVDAVGEDLADCMVDTGRIPFDRIGLYLSACNAVVLPMRRNISNTARWPSKINDYMAAGRPIVATRVGEVDALLQQGIGVAVDDDPRALAEGLAYLMCHPAEADRCGERGRALATGELNWSTIAARLEVFYEGVHSGNTGHLSSNWRHTRNESNSSDADPDNASGAG